MWPEGQPGLNDPANLRTLCKPEHDQKTQADARLARELRRKNK